jgi:hypothetical protein
MSQKDRTVVGITGKPVPKPRTAKQQYELEKKRRQRKHLGRNVGGVQYSADVNPYYNPRQRTFREFLELAEGKKNKDKKIPPNAVPGTYQVNPDGSRSYTLKPTKPFKKPPSKKDIIKLLNQQGGIGGKAIEKELKRRNQEQQEGFSYGSKSYQQQLEKQRKEKEDRKRKEAQQRREELHRERTRGRGIRAVHKGQSGWIRDGKFTPDT